MSNRTPPRFDDGDNGTVDHDATPARGHRTGHGEEWDDDSDEWDEPNYLIRRVVIVGVAVATVAVVALLASRVLGGDSGSGSSSEGANWNTIVVITEDGTTLLSSDGTEELDTITGGSLDNTSLVTGKTLVSLSDAGQVLQTDLEDGSVERGRAARDATLRLSPDNPSIALVDAPNGGDVTIIDTINRDLVSIAEVADLEEPLIFASDVRVNAAGTHVAAPVPNLFQSFVIDLENTTSKALAGRVIAINNNVIVTEQPAGAQSELEFYDLTGERLGSIDVLAPVASMLLPDDSLLYVSAGGTISTASADKSGTFGEIVDPRRIEITSGASADDRLLIEGSGTVFVVGTDGSQIGSVDGRLAIDPTVESRCAVIASGSGVVGVTVIDTESGELLATVERGIAVAASTDGCTVAIGGGAGPQLISDGEVTQIDADSIVDVAPDGSALIVVNGRRTEIVEVGSDEPVEIAAGPALIRFAQR